MKSKSKSKSKTPTLPKANIVDVQVDPESFQQVPVSEISCFPLIILSLLGKSHLRCDGKPALIVIQVTYTSSINAHIERSPPHPLEKFQVSNEKGVYAMNIRPRSANSSYELADRGAGLEDSHHRMQARVCACALPPTHSNSARLDIATAGEIRIPRSVDLTYVVEYIR